MTAAPKGSWRDVLPIHPAAELIPGATEEERRSLAADLAAHGLKVPVVLVSVPGQAGKRCLLDGRTRLDLLEAAGKPVVDVRGRLLVDHKVIRPKDDAEAERLSLSLNVHRRHLTAEKKRELIGAMLKATPEKSNNSIAKQAKADDKTVASVRRKMEARSEIPNVATRTDSKGRKQPARKGWSRERFRQHRAKKRGAVPEPAVASTTTMLPTSPREDIGPDSAGETARLRARVEELENENARLRRENHALKAEIEELKARLLDIPDFLRRAPAGSMRSSEMRPGRTDIQKR
jgi:hypothetical protein